MKFQAMTIHEAMELGALGFEIILRNGKVLCIKERR